LLSSCAACGGARREQEAGDTPATPVKGWPPLTIPDRTQVLPIYRQPAIPVKGGQPLTIPDRTHVLLIYRQPATPVKGWPPLTIPLVKGLEKC